jgi:hypothetical protein
MNPNHFSGGLLLANGAIVLGIWAILFTVPDPGHHAYVQPSAEMFAVIFAQTSPDPWTYRWLGALPLLMLLLAISYLAGGGHSVGFARLRLMLHVSIATAAVIIGPSIPMLFMCLAVPSGWASVTEARRKHSLKAEISCSVREIGE